MNPQKEIEIFFLRSLLRITLAGTILITAADFVFQDEFVQFDAIIDLILVACVSVSFVLFRLGHFNSSVLTITTVTLAAMFYQSLTLHNAATMSFSVVLVVGFIFSVLLQGIIKRVMHVITLTGMVLVFAWQGLHYDYYNQPNAGEVITMGSTYFVLYLIVCYTTGHLKTRYDVIHAELTTKNAELSEKANEIETQNEELLQSQQNLYELNLNLEKMVHDRTDKIKEQNEQLIRYSYNNAHYLRGPVARVLGIIQISKLEQSPDHSVLFNIIDEQAREIDAVVKKINEELGQDAMGRAGNFL